MPSRTPAYHALTPAAFALAVSLCATPGMAAEYSYNCDGTTITMDCEGQDGAGRCSTTAASDPAWNVTCKGRIVSTGRIRMDCRNATDVGGSPVQIEYNASQLPQKLAQGIGDSTGTTCSRTQ